MIFKLPDLPYAYDALEPHFDARTMEVHYTKHHGGYVANLNKAIEGLDLGEPSIDDLLADIHTLPDEVQTAVRNHGGGHANHSMFWTILAPGGGGTARGELSKVIDSQWGDFDRFREEFTKLALGRFGSGWAWLCLNPDGKLLLESTPNQDSPLMYGHHPILGLDVWEHAYYLKYQNRRAEYIQAFFEIVGLERNQPALSCGGTRGTGRAECVKAPGALGPAEEINGEQRKRDSPNAGDAAGLDCPAAKGGGRPTALVFCARACPFPRNSADSQAPSGSPSSGETAGRTGCPRRASFWRFAIDQTCAASIIRRVYCRDCRHFSFSEFLGKDCPNGKFRKKLIIKPAASFDLIEQRRHTAVPSDPQGRGRIRTRGF